MTAITPRHTRSDWPTWIGRVFHPFLVSPLAIVLILWLDQGDFLAGIRWAGICSGFVILPALLYLRDRLRTRQFSDADVSVREHRYGFYLFGGACMGACITALLLLKAPRLLIVGSVTGLLAVALAALVNRVWTKVSIHAGVVVGTATALAFYSIPWAVLFGLISILVCWARWKSGHHTPLQLALGSLIAAGSVIAAFSALGL